MTQPAYGGGSLADVLPSVLGAMDVPDSVNALGLPESTRYVVLLLDGLGLPESTRYVVLLFDGLGANLLAKHADAAPYLTSLMPGRALTSGVPSTTAVSLTSLGTGLPPGAHGVVGYSSIVPESGRLLNALAWDSSVDPRRWQPYPTLFDRATAAGVATRNVSKARFDKSGLTAAAFRGSAHRGADTVDERIDATRFAIREARSALVYVYDSQLDFIGHGYGCESQQWLDELRAADAFALQVRAALPPGAVMVVTADHGMVDIAPDHRVDIDAEPELSAGLRLVAGESRFRHLYAIDGAVPDVLAAYRARLGADALVLTREEAIGRGWFGPVEDRVLPRIGDVVVASLGPVAVVASTRFSQEAALIGLHGSLTADEMAIPLLVDVA